MFEISKEKLNDQRVEDVISAFLLLKNAKINLECLNLKAEDIENSGLLAYFPEQSFFLQEMQKFELPKLPIIKKFYNLFSNALESHVKIQGNFDNLVMRINMKSKGVKKTFDQFFKIQ